MWTKTDDFLVDCIHSVMIAKNWDVTDLAERANVHPSNLVRILNRKYSPSVEVYERLGVCCGFTLKYV